MAQPKALYVLGSDSFERIYGPEERRDIEELVEIVAPVQDSRVAEHSPHLLQEVEIILSGWGGPRLNTSFLQAAPRLRALFYGAGATSGIVTPEAWARGVVVSSAWAANAVPVAEYALAAILWGLKRVLPHARAVRQARSFAPRLPVAGAYGSTVGIVSLGMVGRLVAERLQTFDVKVIAYDPVVDKAVALNCGVRLVSLRELFQSADVVSVHAPWLAETERMITAELVASMKPGATLINTSRGAVLDEPAVLEVLTRREDIQAILDVTHPEPPPPEARVYDMPNVLLTPHIAGSVGRECNRQGRFMVEELRRFLAGQPLRWQITPDVAAHSTHRPAAP